MYFNFHFQVLLTWTSLRFFYMVKSQPFPKRHLLDSSKLKKFADNNFTLDENGRKFSERVENTVAKGEIARYKQFLLFPQCFQRLVLQTSKNKSPCL